EGKYIATYLRRPARQGRTPIVVLQHGGAVSPKAAYGMGRSNPLTAAFIAAGWAVLATDFVETKVPLARPGGAIPFPALCPIEWHDAIAAVEGAHRLTFVRHRRVAIMA